MKPATEYKVVVTEVTSVVWRDVGRAARALAAEVNTAARGGWAPLGGVCSVQAGTSVYLLQGVVRSRGPRTPGERGF